MAIPVRNGGRALAQTLEAVRMQQVEGEVELIVCDSGSTDGSAELARSYGAELLVVAPEDFGHGRTRNLLMERSTGSCVAFLTQDAVPADTGWLARLLAGFSLAPDVALVFGPYRPRPQATAMVARELTEWFAGQTSGGLPGVVRLSPAERSQPSRAFLGARGFFTDANGVILRSAWEQVPFRDVAYAEDHLLAQDLLRAGFAKVFIPDAAVIHSHDYSTLGWLRRSFDEGRALRDVYGWSEPLELRATTLQLWGRVGADLRWVRSHAATSPTARSVMSLLVHSAVHHGARITGAVLGARADRLPTWLVPWLSMERRGR